jgi:hypothetical protein
VASLKYRNHKLYAMQSSLIEQMVSLSMQDFTARHVWKEVMRVVGEEGERKFTYQPLQLLNWWIFQRMCRGSSEMLHNIYYTHEL